MPMTNGGMAAKLRRKGFGKIVMTTISRTKLLEYLDSVMDENLNLRRLTMYCSIDSKIINNKELKSYATN